MSETNTTVLVIDDVELQNPLGHLSRSLNVNVRLLVSVSNFLKSDLPDGLGCLSLDLTVPAHGDVEYQNEPTVASQTLPVSIFAAPVLGSAEAR